MRAPHQDLSELRDLGQNRKSLTLSVAAEASNLLASHSCPKKLRKTLCSSPAPRAPAAFLKSPSTLPPAKHKPQTVGLQSAGQSWEQDAETVEPGLGQRAADAVSACCLSPCQLSDWWLKTAYLEYRLPVVVHSSPGVVLPKQDFLDRQGQLR